jgi:hypothetical protein
MVLEYTMGTALFLIVASLSPRLRSLLIRSRDSTPSRERSYDRVTPSWVQIPSELARRSKKYPFVTWGHLPRLLLDILLFVVLVSVCHAYRLGIHAETNLTRRRGQL